MKKSLIALAVLGAFSAGASAQSSVTLYGIIDGGVQWNESGVNRGTTAAPNWQQESRFGVDSGFQSGSRFGLRGSESLGKGLNAIFTIEGGFNQDTGNSGQGGLLFGRQAWLGLQGGWGTVALGRIATQASGTGSFNLWGGIDPFDTGFGIMGLQATFVSQSAQRWDNSVLYQSPSMAGFKIGGQYSFNVAGGETAPQGSNTSGWNVVGSWAGGPVTVAAAYEVIQYADAGSARALAGNPDTKLFSVGGTFDLKFVKFHAAFADQTAVTTVYQNATGFPTILLPAAVGNYDNEAWMAGVTVPLFGGQLLGSYQQSNAKNINTLTYQFEPDYDVWGVGYTYPLSRRTNIYIAYGQRSWDGTVRVTGGSPALAQATQIFDASQFALGIRHLF